MEAANPVQEAARPKARGKPFQPGHDARRSTKPPGRPKLSDAAKEKQRLAKIAKDRVVQDVHKELGAMVGPAVDRLRVLVDSDSEQIALAAATRVIEYAAGRPVSRTELSAQINATDQVTVVTPEMLKQAAQRLLALQATDATEVDR